MPDWFTHTFSSPQSADPLRISLHLALAALLGLAVAWIYRHTRQATASAGSFTTTLVLLSVLIAMVTQVIGDNVARAFSLVGALSIVRFRTVVRDTRDTAFVIGAVVVGMAVGGDNLWVAVLGVVAIGVTARFMRTSAANRFTFEAVFVLHLRVETGCEPGPAVMALIDTHFCRRELLSIDTCRQGAEVDFVYEVQIAPQHPVEPIVRELLRFTGLRGVELTRRGAEID